MSAEFVDTNVLIYAHDGGAGAKHQHALKLLKRLFEDRSGALSIQVLCEFYAAATKKLSTVSEEAEAVIADLGGRTIRRPAHSDLLKAARLQRRYRIGWWHALIIQSAADLGCSILWTEDFARRTAVRSSNGSGSVPVTACETSRPVDQGDHLPVCGIRGNARPIVLHFSMDSQARTSPLAPRLFSFSRLTVEGLERGFAALDRWVSG